jgi:hypothetical protein
MRLAPSVVSRSLGSSLGLCVICTHGRSTLLVISGGLVSCSRGNWVARVSGIGKPDHYAHAEFNRGAICHTFEIIVRSSSLIMNER